MAVEIPVVIDIEGAFKDAAKRVPAAMEILESSLDYKALEIPVEINKKGDLKEIIDFIGKTKLNADNLKMAIRSVSSEISRMKRAGAKQEDIDTYQKGLLILKSIRLQWQENERAVSKIGDSYFRNLQIEKEYQMALRATSDTINEINDKIAAYTAMLNNSDVGDAKFAMAAAQLGEMSRKLAEVQARAKVLGTELGSVDHLNAKLQELNTKWNALSATEKFASGNVLSSKASALVAEYKKVSEELRRQGLTMSELVAKEQKRAEVLYKVEQRRLKEEGILKTTVKTVSVLEAKVNILQQRLAKTPVGTAQFAKLNQQLRQTQRELDGIRMSMSGVENENVKMDRTLGNLLKKSAYFFGLHTITRFIRNVREVTAEFEMQRVALGGIISDTEEANMLFRQIKAAAIESPFQIKELVTFTKQLSAYRVETENLFDVTMKLADVSAGLGVDMNRLVLAYGQVRAASVLRGQELRQFTEAGIPLVELLAKKFTDLNGRMTSTAEVFDLISKRAVPFEMIAEIFDDMTEAGGTFYKMQEKQAETLAGQWSNLKDALSIMYDEIGNTHAVHSAMEGLINDAKVLMQNWRTVATVLKAVGIQFATMKVASLFLPTLTLNTDLARKATVALAKAEQLESAEQAKANVTRRVAISQLRAYADWTKKAAVAQTAFGRGIKQLVASMAGGGWIGLAVTGLTVITGLFASAYNEAHRLEKELDKIGSEGATSINRSVSNFERLANAAVNAADGSDEQNKALAELQRTYGDIIPSQDLEITKLNDLKGNYESLTEAIREKINMQIQEQKINAATDYYSGKIQKGKKRTKNLLEDYGLDKEQINAVLDEVQNLVDKGMLNVGMTMNERAKVIEGVIKKLTGLEVKLVDTYRYGAQNQFSKEVTSKAAVQLNKLVDTYIELNDQQDEIEKEMENAIGTMGVYANSWDTLKGKIKDVTISEETFGKKHTFAYKKEKIRKEVELMAQAITEAFEGTNIDISGAISGGNIDFEKIVKAAEKAETSTEKYGLTNYIKKIQKSYESIVPTDQMVGVVEKKFGELAKAAGLSMDDIQGYLYRGNQDIREYVKDLQSSLQDAEDAVTKLNMVFAAKGFMTLADRDQLKEAEAYVEVIKGAIEFLEAFKKQSKTTQRHEQDPFIAQLQERMKFMQDFKKGYEDLKKYIGDEGALATESETMLKRGLAIGLSAEDQQRAATDLAGWYQKMREEAFEIAQQKHGAKGTLDDFLAQEIKGTSDQAKTLREFQKLIQSLWDAETDIKTGEMEKKFEKALKEISDEIKRSETARDFYNNILGLTGDEELAANLSVSVYGGTGDEFKKRMQDELNGALQALKETKGFNVSQELEKSFGEMDFASILKLENLPENVRETVQRVQDTIQKHNAEIANNYTKLLLKYDEIEQQRVDITNKYAQEIKTIEEGLALEISGIQKRQIESTEKERLTAEAEARAAAARASAESERDLGLSRLERDYRLFFSSVGIISDKSAMRIAQNQKKMLTDQFVNGQISLSRYKREIREINEQLKKYVTDRSLIEEFLTGGIDGVIAKLEEYSDSIMGFASSIELKKGGFFKPTDEEREFLDKIDKVLNFGAFSRLFKKGASVKIETRISQASENAYKQAILNGKNAADAQAEAYKAAKAAAADAGNEMAEAATKVSGGIAQFELYFYTVSSFFNAIERDMMRYKKSGSAVIEDWAYGLFGLNKGLTSGYEKFKSGDFFGAFQDIGDGIYAMINPVEKWEDKIEEQSETIERLDYQYDRLENSIQKAFGSDYIADYNKQIEALYAKQAAYEEQARLEREKEKNADSSKIKEYENAARDVGDAILDMQGQLSEFFTGTDLTSSAKDFASSWIEAYKEFGSTTEAMKDKFNEMIQNMIENSLAAKIMQEILSPLFKQIDDLAADSELSGADIAEIAATAPEYIEKINAAMVTLMNGLNAAGYNVRQQPGQFTGIKRNIANATEESVNGLTQAMTVNNFYMSHIPAIDANVAQILAIMTGGTAENPATGASYQLNSDQVLQYMSALPNIDQNIAELLRYVKSVISDKNSSSNINVVAVRA